jgi:hypothetical protein
MCKRAASNAKKILGWVNRSMISRMMEVRVLLALLSAELA